MKPILSCYHFLGSVYFALILIATVALFVVAGTFLESATQSHRYAALFTYGSPFFSVLLWGFFINILFAATRRWPFRVGHIPFLTTHLGLLMILAGVLIKLYCGVQGSMTVIEGSGSHEILEPNSYSVYVRSRVGDAVMRYPLKRQLSGYFDPVIADRSDGLSLRISEFYPHSSEQLATQLEGTIVPLNSKLESLIAYDDGFGGYATETPLPAGLETLIEELRKIPSSSDKKALSPPLQVLWQASQKVHADFPLTFVSLLVYWNKSGEWLYPHDLQLSASLAKVFAAMEWNEVPQNDWAGSCWADRLFSQIDPLLKEGIPALTVLKQAHWPLIATLEQEEFENDEEVLTRVTQQIFSAAESLPKPPDFQDDVTPEIQARRLSAYLRAYGIHLKTLMEDSDQAAAEKVVLPILSETAIFPLFEKQPPGKKLEENIPLLTVYASKERQKQTISLAYDRSGTGLKWPILNGQFLLGFQSLFTEIPHHIRLRQARQINYPNSSQAYSYEADIIITERHTGISTEQTISMNRVHETWDGYRFYLSSIASPDDGGAKRIQIVVNRDPAKYMLTYPGAMILSGGIIMLFTRRQGRKRKD
ncbi:MAG: hypothetical protein WCF65_01250 [Parachlamydiaceae bacterium]